MYLQVNELGMFLEELSLWGISLNLSLHHNVTDVRAFSWLNYHKPEAGQFKILPRYSALLFLRDKSWAELSLGLRSSRRQEIGYAVKREELKLLEGDNVENLFGCVDASFKRQGVEIDGSEAKFHECFVNYFLQQGTGVILGILNKNNVTVASAFVFIDFDSTLHVPLVGIKTTRYGGSLLYAEIIKYGLKMNCEKIDFNGANSPDRSYFKHAFGAAPKLYFEAVLKNPGAGFE